MIPQRGFRIGSFRGIKIYLHWSWFIVFLLLLWVVIQFFQVNVESPAHVYVPLSVVTTFLFFASVLLHELSHSIVANRNGIPIKKITLFVFGGVAQMSKDVNSPGVEFKMAVAGPLCSYALCLVFGALAYLAYVLGADSLSFGLMLLSVVNFGLGTFNLIPGFPLDGGRILRSLLWHHSGDLLKSTRTASRLGEGLGFLLIAGGVVMFFLDLFQPQNDLMLASLWFVLIGAFLVQAAYNGYRQVRVRSSLSGKNVGDITRYGVPAVEASTSLEEVYRIHLEKAPLSIVPVLKQGKLAAFLKLTDLRPVDNRLWAETPAVQVSRPVIVEDTASPSLPLFDALLRMERSGREFLWVVEEGRLLGVILRDDARRLSKQRFDRRKTSNHVS
ncbi:MAG: site-2 protease family protein [Actinomycetota bacterium]|nr:site-2 protease family protein [Actinomycetota bacterium]